MSQKGALRVAAERLRDVPGFPKRPGRPRKISPTALKVDVPRRQRPPREVQVIEPPPLEGRPPVRDPVVIPALVGGRPALSPRLLGPKSAGAYLGVSAWTARQLAERGTLRLVKLPGIARWLVDRADLDALIEQAKAAR